MGLELQALPKAIGSKADQNEPADDHQTLQHECWTSPTPIGFKPGRAKGIVRRFVLLQFAPLQRD